MNEDVYLYLGYSQSHTAKGKSDILEPGWLHCGENEEFNEDLFWKPRDDNLGLGQE